MRKIGCCRFQLAHKFWFSVMILVKNSNKIGHIKGIWSICYRTSSQILHGGSICPNKNANQTSSVPNRPAYHCLSLPVPTATVPASTNSMQATFLSLNGWAKIKPFDGYTAKPVERVSVNDKAHLCRIQSCHRPMWYALSNVWAMAVLLKPQQISVKSIPEQYSVCWTDRVSVPRISIVYNLKTSMNLSKSSRWMNCTAKQSSPNTKPRRLKCQKSCVNALVKKGQNVASYGSGRKQQVSARIDHRPTHSPNSYAIDCFAGGIFQRQKPSADSDRRPFAVSTGYLAGIWTDQTLPS